MAVVRTLKARLRALEEETASQQATESGFHATAVNNLRDMERERVRVRREEADVYNFLKTPGPMGPAGLMGAAGLPGADGAVGHVGLMGLMGSEGLEGPEGREGREGRMGPTGIMGELTAPRRRCMLLWVAHEQAGAQWMGGVSCLLPAASCQAPAGAAAAAVPCLHRKLLLPPCAASVGGAYRHPCYILRKYDCDAMARTGSPGQQGPPGREGNMGLQVSRLCCKPSTPISQP